MRSADVAVVGAGIIGLSVACHLRERGAEVVVVERSGVGAGASGVQPGGVRQQWGTRVNCLLARESLLFYRRAEEVLESPLELGFRACGYLFLAHSQEGLNRLRAAVAVQNAAGVPSRLVGPEETAELVPGLQPESVTGGAWCGEDGYFDRPQAVVEAFARGLRVELAEVVELSPEGGGWALHLRGGGKVRAGAAVVAAGCDTVALLEPLGLQLPIAPEPRYLLLSRPIRERLLEPLVVSSERRLAVKQLGTGRVLASFLDAVGDPETEASRWREAVRAGIRELVPLLEYVELPICVGGVYDATPDRQPAVGPVPGQPGLWVAAGFSGHGFMLAPAIGRILADALLDLGRDEALDVLDPARFRQGRLAPEPQVI